MAQPNFDKQLQLPAIGNRTVSRITSCDQDMQNYSTMTVAVSTVFEQLTRKSMTSKRSLFFYCLRHIYVYLHFPARLRPQGQSMKYRANLNLLFSG
jgi:hypothetical protein